MATSRHALLFALTAQGKELARAAREHSLLEAECPVPFLDAWDDIFLGWAFSLGDLHDRAMDRLQRAEDYFRRNGLRPAAALATWALAEAHFLRGDAGAASDLLQALTPASDLTAALKPLLAGRLLLDRASAPEKDNAPPISSPKRALRWCKTGSRSGRSG